MKEKSKIIAESLSSAAGRRKLADSMREPLGSLFRPRYPDIGKKLMMVEELPEGAYALYEFARTRGAIVILEEHDLPADSVRGMSRYAVLCEMDGISWEYLKEQLEPARPGTAIHIREEV